MTICPDEFDPNHTEHYLINLSLSVENEDTELNALNGGGEKAERYLKAHTDNLHLDSLERVVFEDFNSPVYTSNTAVNFMSWR